jgi:branched-chain amino acid transport system permease protein
LATTFGSSRLRAAAGSAGPALAIVAVTLVLFPVPLGVAVQGLILGLLGALVAVGMALVYRANRILNFAQGELGTAPTVLVVSLVVYSGWNYFLALGIGILGAILLGSIVELAIIRRFFKAPRLILTVATIGLAQLLAVGAAVIPLIWGKRPTTNLIHVPFTFNFTIEPIVFSADHLVALIVAPLSLLAVAMWLRFTDVGIAVRASAERSDRASLLGVPVKRLQTVVWAAAALLSFVGVFLQAGILGLPVIDSLNLTVLLAALAALMLGRMTDLPSITMSAVALGLLEQGIVWNNPRSPELVEPIFAAVIIVCLLVRKLGTTRAEQDAASSWQASAEVRPIPHELRSLPEVRAARWGGGAVLLGLIAAVPLLLGPGNQEKATALVIFCIITMSVVVLTGWAGQVSLGQMTFVGFGAAAGGYATLHWHLDFGLCLLLAGAVGAFVALLVGLPALRLRGLFLAVTTLAFSMASTAYFLNDQHFSWVPDAGTTIPRPTLLGFIDLGSQSSYYYVCLVVLGLAALAVRGIRYSRTGRVLLALRENERGAQAFGVNLVRAKLTAFAISGFLAAVGGCLFVHLLTGFSPDSYSPYESFTVFIAAVVGGVGSMLGAVLGAGFLKGGEWFLPGPQWQLLVSGAGVLLVLWIVPGGLGDIVYRVRDAGLRWVAGRRGIIVPSLIADVRQAEPEPEASIVAAVAEIDTLDEVAASMAAAATNGVAASNGATASAPAGNGAKVTSSAQPPERPRAGESVS